MKSDFDLPTTRKIGYKEGVDLRILLRVVYFKMWPKQPRLPRPSVCPTFSSLRPPNYFPINSLFLENNASNSSLCDMLDWFCKVSKTFTFITWCPYEKCSKNFLKLIMVYPFSLISRNFYKVLKWRNFERLVFNKNSVKSTLSPILLNWFHEILSQT